MKKAFLLLILAFGIQLAIGQTKTPSKTTSVKSSGKPVRKNAKPAIKKPGNEALKKEIKTIQSDKSLSPQQKKKKIKTLIQEQKKRRFQQKKQTSKP